jgi:hypothetical protein
MTRIPLNTHNKKKEEGRGKKEEGRRKKEEGRRKKEEGRVVGWVEETKPNIFGSRRLG